MAMSLKENIFVQNLLLFQIHSIAEYKVFKVYSLKKLLLLFCSLF